MALEKGEVDGYCGWALGSLRQRAPDWIKTKKVRFLVQFATASDPELVGVPLATDLTQNPLGADILSFLTSDATLAWTMLAPPGLSADRANILRNAFDAMMRDKDVLADAEREKLEVDPVSGSELQSLVDRLMRTPPVTLAAIKRINEQK
jgi:hypothetical protein